MDEKYIKACVLKCQSLYGIWQHIEQLTKNYRELENMCLYENFYLSFHLNKI